MRHIFRSAPARFAIIAFTTFLAFSLFSRVALLITASRDVTWDLSVPGAFATGIWFDAASAVFAALPWLLLGAVTPVRLWKSSVGKWILALFMTIFAGILIFITTAEWFFWDEFGARFNFIAVDYLIWTQEVWGNISESYPMPAIFAGIGVIAGLITWTMARKGWFSWAAAGTTRWLDRCIWPVAGIGLASLAMAIVSQPAMPAFANQYNGELGKNGCWSFFAAFKQMELNYDKWYPALPQKQALAEAKQLLVTPDAPATTSSVEDLRRSITGRGPEQRWNVITVCMESMSAEYMAFMGHKAGLTPCLDHIAENSLFFENLYATGTRTVRGMEALTLNLPPTPGQAIIYRPEGTDLTTTFSPFLDRGYDCAFFYGGDGRFDFMNRYFSTAGCRIMDAGAWQPEDTTFKTAWGACDEDLFNKTISEADASHAAGKPFHFFCMTTSNHRPYTFPAGRIDMVPNGKRKPALKYADWTIGKLIEDASKRPWFNNTVFIIIADHCASSAGKTDLDVTKFRIPGMIYAPSLVPAKTVSTLASQIDVMPTLFGLLNWNYNTLSYGHDLLAPSAAARPGRAFVSNYQKIAMLTPEGLAILKPNRITAAWDCDRETGDYAPLAPATAESLIHDTTVFYQSASWLFNSGKLKRSYRESAAATTTPGPKVISAQPANVPATPGF